MDEFDAIVEDLAPVLGFERRGVASENTSGWVDEFCSSWIGPDDIYRWGTCFPLTSCASETAKCLPSQSKRRTLTKSVVTDPLDSVIYLKRFETRCMRSLGVPWEAMFILLQLPDMDFAINSKAEGRVLVPWEQQFSNLTLQDPSGMHSPHYVFLHS